MGGKMHGQDVQQLDDIARRRGDVQTRFRAAMAEVITLRALIQQTGDAPIAARMAEELEAVAAELGWELGVIETDLASGTLQ